MRALIYEVVDKMIRELVVISGKGGTGKTSIAASLATLASLSVIADCDVDAADMHLVLNPRVLERHDFFSGHEARIRPEACTACGICSEQCRFDAITPGYSETGRSVYLIDPYACEGCGLCVRVCPQAAIDFPDRHCGQWMISETRHGPMVHAKLKAAAENSGKLVSTVRREARRIAEEDKLDFILVDGPPGIGCPVIASVTGATDVLAVTEPTVSGEHDLERVLALADHFKIPVSVCVNKWDLNSELTDRIEDCARKKGARIAGRVRYDRTVTLAQIEGRSVVETGGPCADDIRTLWRNLNR